MATAEIKFDPKQLIGKITELEKVILPNVLYQSLNKAVFRTSREELRDAAANTFTNKVPFTLKSFLYDKPRQQGNFLESRIYIRDDAPKGNAPADYLSPQITGGSVYRTRFQKRLETKGFLGGSQGKYMMPALKQMQRSKLPKGEYTRALWGVSAMNEIRGGFDYDKKQFKTAGSYVWIPKDLDAMADWSDELAARASMIRSLNKGKLPRPGIYKVMKSKLKQTFVMLDNVPTVGKKFDFVNIAKNSVQNTFKEELIRNLKR